MTIYIYIYIYISIYLYLVDRLPLSGSSVIAASKGNHNVFLFLGRISQAQEEDKEDKEDTVAGTHVTASMHMGSGYQFSGFIRGSENDYDNDNYTENSLSVNR